MNIFFHKFIVRVFHTHSMKL